MKISFRTKLLASHVGVVAAVVLVVIVELSLALGSDLTRQLEQRLEQQAAGAAAWVGPGRHPERLAGRLSQVVHAGVAILDRDGNLLADSEDEDLVTRKPNALADLVEMRAARDGRIGHATRANEQNGEDTHYVAVPGENGLVLRLAVPLSDIHATQRAMNGRLLFASLVGVLIALGLGFLAARNAARPLRAMSDVASRIADGDYDVRIASPSPDEFGELAESLASLASQLEARIGDLTAERDRLSAILEGMAEGVIVLSPTGSVIIANPSSTDIVGDGSPLVGRSSADVFKHPAIRDLVEEAKQRGEIASAEIEDRATGRSVAVYARALGAGTGGGVVAVLRDMTQIRRLETMRRDFVANASHELRTPVTAIQGYAETLLGGKADAATSEKFLNIIHRHALRLGALLASLLRLSELEARAPADLVREAARVGPIAEHVAEAIRERNGASARVTVDFPADAVALGDPLGLEQVIENLVENAIRYGKEGGEVRVSGKRTGDRVEITVADEGPGIEARHVGRLFERFYRADPSRSRERGGSGLGLAIVKHLVDSMGGTVRVESELGKGSRFIVDLPAATV